MPSSQQAVLAMAHRSPHFRMLKVSKVIQAEWYLNQNLPVTPTLPMQNSTTKNSSLLSSRNPLPRARNIGTWYSSDCRQYKCVLVNGKFHWSNLDNADGVQPEPLYHYKETKHRWSDCSRINLVGITESNKWNSAVNTTEKLDHSSFDSTRKITKTR